MPKFYDAVKQHQVSWRGPTSIDERGFHNGTPYAHILPRHQWESGLWSGIREGQQDSVVSYLRGNGVTAHTGSNNLCSSWVLCANLYFPFRDQEGRELLASFVQSELAADVTSVSAVELEYEPVDPALGPSQLLGEDGGSRGTGQTSPDLALEVETPTGPGLILVESKYTEHWFYECSGHRKKVKGRTPNPKPERCDNCEQVLRSPDTECHLTSWRRTYWQHLRPKAAAWALLSRCPAATGAYQLFRQQAYAEALASTGRWSLVMSTVAYDARNQQLFSVLRSGRDRYDLRTMWSDLFELRAPFRTFTHQAWVAWVRSHGSTRWADWQDYIRQRYDL